MLVHIFHRPIKVEVSVTVDPGVARMVILPMEVHQIFVRQFGNLQRVTTGNVSVRMVWQYFVEELLPKNSRIFRKRSFHFVVNYSLEDQVRVFVLQLRVFQPPPFLQKVQVFQVRSEDRIQIDRLQISVIHLIGGGKGIQSIVRSGHGIHERGQASVQHLEKRIPHRKSLRSAQDVVLQYVRQAGRIERGGPKVDGEHIVRILAIDVQILQTGFVMGKHVSSHVEIRNELSSRTDETIVPVPGSEAIRSFGVG